ncbi:hypothetical protein E4T44_13363 [Aureobasidium sp. EXF-8845]|nr:hypothetical protein E4T44_13363 [Aureobasidium sp. EXF-8845]KAI4790167.1 hypothetical protein E4T45_13229 [Aureobasidium sp. EXF-8846]
MESGNTTPHDQSSPPPDEYEHEHEHEHDEDVANPQDQIESFDWQGLETEYLEAMADCKTEEDAQLKEFASLSQFFGVWAETVSGHEQKRSHQRLRTQSTLVIKEEKDLEDRRNHYVQVVEAFRRALSMLDR